MPGDVLRGHSSTGHRLRCTDRIVSRYSVSPVFVAGIALRTRGSMTRVAAASPRSVAARLQKAVRQSAGSCLVVHRGGQTAGSPWRAADTRERRSLALSAMSRAISGSAAASTKVWHRPIEVGDHRHPAFALSTRSTSVWPPRGTMMSIQRRHRQHFKPTAARSVVGTSWTAGLRQACLALVPTCRQSVMTWDECKLSDPPRRMAALPAFRHRRAGIGGHVGPGFVNDADNAERHGDHWLMSRPFGICHSGRARRPTGSSSSAIASSPLQPSPRPGPRDSSVRRSINGFRQILAFRVIHTGGDQRLLASINAAVTGAQGRFRSR